MGLKGIPSIISPELLKILAEMGHGDTIVLTDAHFPGQSIGAKNNISVVRADGVTSIPNLLRAVLSLIELDTYIEAPVTLMQLTKEDKDSGVIVPHWKTYKELLKEDVRMFLAERFEFYKKAGEAYAIVVTGDTGIYGNIILTKGVTHEQS